MQVVMISELVYAEPRPTTPFEKDRKYQEVLASFNVPIYLGRCHAINHDTKTDRYSIVFVPATDKKVALRVTDDVVQFVMVTGLDTAGYWQGRMEGGVLVDACLIRA